MMPLRNRIQNCVVALALLIITPVAVHADPLSSLMRVLDLASDLGRYDLVQDQKKQGADMSRADLIVIDGQTVHLNESRRRTMTQPGSDPESVVRVYNWLLHQVDNEMPEFHVRHDGSVGLDSLEQGLMQVRFQNNLWRMEPLPWVAPLLNSTTSPRQVVESYNTLMPSDAQLVLHADGTVGMAEIEGVSFEMSMTDGFWELKPQGGLEGLSNPLLGHAEIWSIYRDLLAAQGKSMRSVLPFLRQDGHRVMYTDGYISYCWYEIKFDTTWTLEPHPEVNDVLEVLPLIAANRNQEAIRALQAMKPEYMQCLVGDLYLRDGNLEEGEAVARQVIARHPGSLFAGTLMASVDLERKRYAAANSRCGQMIATHDRLFHDGMGAVYSLQACAREALGNHEEALRLYERAVSLDREQGNLEQWEAENGRAPANYRMLMGRLESASR